MEVCIGSVQVNRFPLYGIRGDGGSSPVSSGALTATSSVWVLVHVRQAGFSTRSTLAPKGGHERIDVLRGMQPSYVSVHHSSDQTRILLDMACGDLDLYRSISGGRGQELRGLILSRLGT